MTWVAPMTFVANTVLTAAQLNTYLRDNLNETAPAKATTAGYHFVTSGPGAIAERAIRSDTISSSNTTTSTAYVTITNAPTVTVETGTLAIWLITCSTSNSVASTATYSSVEVTGATSIGASDSRCLMVDGLPANQPCRMTSAQHMSVTAGTNTFTMQNRVAAGTGTWVNRQLTIIAL